MENIIWSTIGILVLLFILGFTALGVKENLRRCAWCPQRAWGKPHQFKWIHKESGAEVQVCDPCFWKHYQHYADQAFTLNANLHPFNEEEGSVIPNDAFGEYRMHPDTSRLLWGAYLMTTPSTKRENP